MKATYLVRFDDLCPTMNWSVWDRIEEALLAEGIRPIMAVVPDNRDEFLAVSSPNPVFWDRVRAWRDHGWSIAMHGYQHRPITRAPGIVGINARSEFAGLSRERQERMLREALAIFERESLRPEIWAAPNHSFDEITVECLRSLGVGVVSDGLFTRPHRSEDGMMWIPHQLWRLRRMPPGVWTVGIHHNRWTRDQLGAFLRDLGRYRSRISHVHDVLERFRDRREQASDRLVCRAYLGAVKLKRRARELGVVKTGPHVY